MIFLALIVFGFGAMAYAGYKKYSTLRDSNRGFY